MNEDDSSQFENNSFRHAGNVSGNGSSEMSIGETWGWAFLFVSIINLSTVMGIIFFPLMKKSFYTMFMRVMIGLAIGSLSGSSLFHLIPAAFDLEDVNIKGQSYINIAVVIWVSMWLVMLLECTIKIVVKTRAIRKRKRRRKEDPLQHSNDNLPLKRQPVSLPIIVSNANNGAAHILGEQDALQLQSLSPPQNKLQEQYRVNRQNAVEQIGTSGVFDEEDEIDEEDEDDNPDESSLAAATVGKLPIYRSTLSLSKTVTASKSSIAAGDDNGSKEKEDGTIKTVAWLIIIGDSIHNFVDGVSIGAGFVKDFQTGAVICLAIICEEFPHELGDFAILINSGFSLKKALALNFMSGLTCYAGMVLGLLLGEIEWANYIFAFAAGIFLYVSWADMAPEITSLIEQVSDVNPKKAWKILAVHQIGILLGITILYLLAVFQPET